MMSINELLNKDPDKVLYEAPLIILYIKSVVCMANNGKYTNHTSHISRRLHLIRNDENWQMHNIDPQLSDIATNNFGENDLNPIMKYIMVSLENWYRTLVKEGWQDSIVANH